MDNAKILFAAAVSEFASILKEHAFPTEVSSVAGGSIDTSVYLPTISWSKFDGTVSEALEQIQSRGLIENPSESNKAFPGRIPSNAIRH